MHRPTLGQWLLILPCILPALLLAAWVIDTTLEAMW